MSEQLAALEHMFPDCVVEVSLPIVSVFINNDRSQYESSITFSLSSNHSVESPENLQIDSAEIQSTTLSLADCELLTKELTDVIKADPTDLIAAAVFAHEQLLSKLESAAEEEKKNNTKVVSVSKQSGSQAIHGSTSGVDDQWLKRLSVLKSNVLKVKKSVFFANTAHVLSIEDINRFHAFLCDTQGIDNATHNIVAYRLCQTGDQSSLQEGFDDDGEHAAGGRLLLLMQKMKVYNRVAIVTRYFGGVHLGPARFKHINDCAQEVILKAKQVDPNFCSGL